MQYAFVQPLTLEGFVVPVASGVSAQSPGAVAVVCSPPLLFNNPRAPRDRTMCPAGGAPFAITRGDRSPEQRRREHGHGAETECFCDGPKTLIVDFGWDGKEETRMAGRIAEEKKPVPSLLPSSNVGTGRVEAEGRHFLVRKKPFNSRDETDRLFADDCMRNGLRKGLPTIFTSW